MGACKTFKHTARGGASYLAPRIRSLYDLHWLLTIGRNQGFQVSNFGTVRRLITEHVYDFHFLKKSNGTVS
jgi:hypothetical protein